MIINEDNLHKEVMKIFDYFRKTKLTVKEVEIVCADFLESFKAISNEEKFKVLDKEGKLN